MPHFATTSPATGYVVISFPAQAVGGDQGVALSAIIADELKRSVHTIILDLSAVDLMNSTGLGMLVSALATTGRSQVTLVLACVPERVRTLLEITHLDQVFTAVASVNEALAPLQ